MSTHPWDVGYSDDEVEELVNDLRHPATHADLRKQASFASDNDVQHHLVGIEQAAYDVLFNKRDWHTADSDRGERSSLRCAVTATGRIVNTETARVRTMSGWDLHHAFLLRGSLKLPEGGTPEFGLKFARWHFTDSERRELQAHGVGDL